MEMGNEKWMGDGNVASLLCVCTCWGGIVARTIHTKKGVANGVSRVEWVSFMLFSYSILPTESARIEIKKQILEVVNRVKRCHVHSQHPHSKQHDANIFICSDFIL